VDSAGGLYIADSFNHRVLHYPSGSTSPDRVYGQLGSFSSNILNKGGVSKDSLNEPYGLAVDSAGGLYIADSFNHRVLHYPSGSTSADRVYGQLGSFSSQTANKSGVSKDSLYQPFGLAIDSAGGLYIADYGNHRVLHYPSGSTSADWAYGQLGSFSSLFGPSGVALDSAGGVYIADHSNNRVLFYPAN